MDPSSWLLIAVYVLLLFASAYFSATEMAFSSVSKIKLLSYKEEEQKNADLALKIQEKYDLYLTTLLVGNNLVNCGAAAVATLFSGHVYTALIAQGASVKESVVTTIATAVTTVVVFIFAETVPKNYAKDMPERWAMASASSLRVVSYVLYPISIVFMGISRILNKIVVVKEEPTVTEEELSTIIENSEEDGVLDEEQSELLQSALEFSKTRVADVLTLRADVEWLDASLSREEIFALVKQTKFSRLPVCRGGLDHPLGILIVNDYLKAYIADKNVRVSRLIRKPYFTTLDASIDDLKEEMSGKRQTMALVHDRAGTSIIGIVTIEDFIEEIVGEIFDEQDVVDDDFMKLGGNYFRVSGRLALHEMYTRIGIGAPAGIAPHKPVSTWILEKLGRLPVEGDCFVFGDLTVEIDETEQNRVLHATVKLSDPEIDLPIEESAEDASEISDEEVAK
jgi:CBS domain containing-hemolysin-like protein